MYLTRVEERMLEGDEGVAVQICMDWLVKYGEAMDSKRLIKADSVTIGVLRSQVLGMDLLGPDFKDVKVRTLTASLHICPSTETLETFGVKETPFTSHRKTLDMCRRLGAHPYMTCTPFILGFIPVKNQIFAWSESGLPATGNSVFGARGNLEGVGAFCAAITGRIPEYGFHIDENRIGTHLIKVECKLRDYVDFDLLGYYVGKRVMLDVPVFVGMPQPDMDMLKTMGFALNTSGGVQMYHILGVTPEAPTLEAALGGDKPREKITVGWDELEESYEYLNSTSEEKVDYAVLGCPHLSMNQIKEVASLLEGKKVKIPLCICMSAIIKAWAERMGYAEIITKAGGMLLEGMCPLFLPPKGVKVMATNGCKQAHYSPGLFGRDTPEYGVRWGSTRDVVNAAITGIWGGNWRNFK